MSKLKENIELLMQKKGWNPYDLANASGVNQSTIHRFLAGDHGEPRSSTIKKLAVGLGVTELQLRGLIDNYDTKLESSLLTVQEPSVWNEPIKSGFVPLISWVSAGIWCEAIDSYAVGDAEEWMHCPEKHSDNTYALRVRGDSMTNPIPSQPSYPEGCIIYVDPKVQVHNGCRVIAKLPGINEATFKEYREDGGKRYLKPLNPQYPMVEIFDNTLLCGVIIGKYISEK